MLLGLLLISAIAAVFSFARSGGPLPVTVSFIGYTNATTSGRFAVFAVTNCGRATIRRWGVFHPENQRQLGVLSTLRIGPNVSLAPGQSEVISVSAPTNAGVWRVVLDFSRDGPQLKFSDWMGRTSGGLIHSVLPNQWRSVPVQFARSDWIEQ
jgi:hypothetical protein